MVFAGWVPLYGEIAYILLYILFGLHPYGDSLAFPSFGVFLIIIIWIVQKKTFQAFILLISSSILLCIRTEDLALALLSNLLTIITVLLLGFSFRFLNNKLQESHTALLRSREDALQATQQVKAELAAQLHNTIAKDLARLAITAQNIAVKHGELASELDSIVQIAHTASRRIRPIILNLDSQSKSQSLQEVIETCTKMLSIRKLVLKVNTEETIFEYLDQETIDIAALIIRETATNALKYAAENSEVNLFLNLDAEVFSVTMSNKILTSKASSEVTGGFGLANLEHRVQEFGGTLYFVRKEDRWIVYAALPNLVGEPNHV
ncbi:sensory histidine kinase UhpB [Corynebacterium caspium DSM 44850]|nr:sensory histidine kinase UhpB [Corynebacterium caspium DSM 44850]